MNKKILKIIVLLSIVGALTIPSMVLASGHTSYTPISELAQPGAGTDVDTENPDKFFEDMFILFISVATIIALIRLMICGIQYVTSESITTKGAAKKCIQLVVGGLLLILISFVILTTLNSDTANIDFQSLRDKITNSIKVGGSGGSPTPSAPLPGDTNGDGIVTGYDSKVDLDSGYCFFERNLLPFVADKVVCGSVDPYNPTNLLTQSQCDLLRDSNDGPCFSTTDGKRGAGTFCFDTWTKSVPPGNLNSECGNAIACIATQQARVTSNSFIPSVDGITECYKPAP